MSINGIGDTLARAAREAHYRILAGSVDVRVDPGNVLASAVLSALASSAHTVAGPLPEPDLIGAFGSVWTVRDAHRFDGPIGDVQYRPDTGRIEIRDDYERSYTLDDVERDALVLLAAVAVGRAAAQGDET
jgi:hypothetical protein